MAMIRGGSNVICSHCKKHWRKGSKGEKKFRRHRRHSVRCWDWVLTYE